MTHSTGRPAPALSDNVQRLATRRQHERPLDMSRLPLQYARRLVRAISAVHPGPRRRRAEAPTALLSDGASSTSTERSFCPPTCRRTRRVLSPMNRSDSPCD
jgi:hypothetical protein